MTRTTVTEADGKFRFPAINPGRFTIVAELSGFTTVEVTDIEMTIGLGLTQDFTMALQSVSEKITVVGIAPVVDTTKSEVSGVVTQQQIEMLPINSRQYLSLALLMPGTSMDSTRRILCDRQCRRVGDVQLDRQFRRRRRQQLRRRWRAPPEPAGRCGRRIQGQQRAIQGRVRAGDRRHRASGDQIGHQQRARQRVRVLPGQVPERPGRVRNREARVPAAPAGRQRGRPGRAQQDPLLRRRPSGPSWTSSTRW